jgi:peptidoglycan/xylan/chitin deacetylase (PgdA/CDA1 family)
MKFALFISTSVLIITVSSAAGSWGTLSDIRYKIKNSDGNLWEPLVGQSPILQGRECPGTVTFTFDDGPDHRTTPILLDVLDKYSVKAAFFINATKIHQKTAGGIENQAVLRDIYRRRHFIGSHTFSHKDITTLDETGWQNEIKQAEQVTASIIGRRPFLFRPPFGRISDATSIRLSREGYTVVMWNLDSGDWRAKSAVEILKNTQRIIEENPDGGILLFHDTNRSTVEALPLILEWIDERNDALSAQGKRPLQVVGIEHYIQSFTRGR